jgi:hypothetical protein
MNPRDTTNGLIDRLIDLMLEAHSEGLHEDLPDRACPGCQSKADDQDDPRGGRTMTHDPRSEPRPGGG